MQRSVVLMASLPFDFSSLRVEMERIVDLHVTDQKQGAGLEARFRHDPHEYIFLSRVADRELAIDTYIEFDDVSPDFLEQVCSLDFIVMLTNSLNLLRASTGIAIRHALA